MNPDERYNPEGTQRLLDAIYGRATYNPQDEDEDLLGVMDAFLKTLREIRNLPEVTS